MEQKEKIFADGIRFEKPHEKSPDFVKGKLSFKVDDAISFLQKHKDDRGWVNCDLKKSKGGKLYLELDTWKKEQAQNTQNNPEQDLNEAFPVEDSSKTPF